MIVAAGFVVASGALAATHEGAAAREAAAQVAAAAAPALQARHVPGLALAAVKDGEIAFATLGVRDVDGRPVTPDTFFYVASCTKTYTALLLAKLAEQDELELDDPVRAVLPSFELADEEAAARLTLRDLLCHRPGLDCPEAVFLDAYTGEITDERFFRLLARKKPSGRCQYTNTHFTLAARAAEAVRVEPWQELLESELFRPLGMTRTTARASVAFADADCAWPMRRSETGWRRLRVKSDRSMHAAGGLCTTARDAAAWIRLHLARGELDGRRLVAAQTIEDALALQERDVDRDLPMRGVVREGFGLAWQVGKFHGRRFAMHGGGYPGFSAVILLLPDDRIGAAALCNSGDADLVHAAGLTLLARMSGADVEDALGWLARQPLPARSAPAAAGAVASELGAPPDRFAGTFLDADFGTLVLRAEEERLVGAIGEYACVVRVEAAGGWRLLFDGGGDRIAARPLLAEGAVAAVEVELHGRWVRFQRAAGS